MSLLCQWLLSKWFSVVSSEYSAIDNSWQLPNGAITVITEELAKHESRVLQPDIFKAKCNFPTKYIIKKRYKKMGMGFPHSPNLCCEHAKRVTYAVLLLVLIGVLFSLFVL